MGISTLCIRREPTSRRFTVELLSAQTLMLALRQQVNRNNSRISLHNHSTLLQEPLARRILKMETDHLSRPYRTCWGSQTVTDQTMGKVRRFKIRSRYRFLANMWFSSTASSAERCSSCGAAAAAATATKTATTTTRGYGRRAAPKTCLSANGIIE